MARIAFYAPLKSPNHPTPSGEREMARNLMKAIRAGGAKVDLISELRTFDKIGDRDCQSALRQQAETEILRLQQQLPKDTRLWVTYHNYYKAPDLIGPKVCATRGIPYVQIESTRANKRLTGPWADFAQAAHEACDAAEIVFYLTEQDHFALNRDRTGDQKLVHLPPFLPLEELPQASSGTGPMLSVGMMRHGDKLASYRLIAETLAHLTEGWTLELAGDGPARGEVEAIMAPFGDRVTFLGQLDRSDLQTAYQRAALFFWPGVNEAFGMVYLEAQASGLPIVAQDRPGVRDILLPGTYPHPDTGSDGLATSLNKLMENAGLRHERGRAARRMIHESHLLSSATGRIWSAITPCLEVT